MSTTPSSRVALITGANKGIGFHIARQLAAAGATVLLGSRNLERGRTAAQALAADGFHVEPIRLDVTDDDSVAAAAASVSRRHDRLDVLVNNAGITSGLAPTTTVTRGDMLATFDTNVAGVAAVTNALLPLLRRSDDPRIVNVSSELGMPAFVSDASGPFAALNNAAYQASKAALNLLTVLYANELAIEGITVLAVGPGYRATDLNGGLPTPGAGEPEGGADVAVRAALGPGMGTGTFYNHKGNSVAW